MSEFVRVAGTRPVQQFEGIIGQVKEMSPQCRSELGSSPAVIGVGAFVDSLRVVEDSEQPNNFDVCASCLAQAQPVLKHSCPMRNAVNAVDGQNVFRQDRLDDGSEVVLTAGHWNHEMPIWGGEVQAAHPGQFYGFTTPAAKST